MPTTAQAQVARNETDVHAVCRAQAPEGGQAFNECIARMKLELVRRRDLCAREMRSWVLPSAEQLSAYRACLAATSVDEFRVSMRQRAGASGPQAVAIESDRDFAHWVGWDGPAPLQGVVVHAANWLGEVAEGLPVGVGKLTVRLDYLNDRKLRKPGELVLKGRLKAGRLDGPIELLTHPALAGPQQGLVNIFVDGVNQGLPLSEACAAAVPEFHPGTAVRWIGSCRGDQLHVGLAIYSHRGLDIDLICFNKGRQGHRNELDAFLACDKVWSHLPNYCQVGDYRGQCRNGAPWGVGVRVETLRTASFDSVPSGFWGAMAAMAPGRTSHRIQRGQFRGDLSGFGYHGAVSNCGMAGCTGPVVEDIGWFQDGRLQFACSQYTDCARQVSGRDFTETGPLDAASVAELKSLRTKGDFAAAMSAFDISRERDDLRRALTLAATPQQRQDVELALIRVAGYDKVFALSAEVSAEGSRAVRLDETEALLGFVRTTSARLPLTLRWRLHNDPQIVALRYGSYRVRATVGIRVTTGSTVCVGEFCRNERNTETIARTVSGTLSAAALQLQGSFDLRTQSAAAGVVLGAGMVERLDRVEPFIRVESVELQ